MYVYRAALLCGQLANPAEGGVMIEGGRRVDSVATYSCTVGFFLVGNRTRMCREDLRWSGEVPTCSELIIIGFRWYQEHF